MSDERETPDDGDSTESDGLDAWLAANFPPKAPDAAPPPVETTPPPPVQEFPIPVSSELPPVFPPAQPPGPPHPWLDSQPSDPQQSGAQEAGIRGAGVHEPGAPRSGQHEPGTHEPGVPPVADELAGLPPEPDVPADPTELLGGFGEGPGGDSALDALFGESRFRDYEAEPAPSENPFAVRTVVVPTSGDGVAATAAPGISRTQKVLMWVAGSLVAVLALVALFMLGTRLPDLLGPAPAVVTSPTNTPTPTATALPLGPVEPGVYRWDELLGGECLDPYDGPWEEEFTVVDCGGPHPAQLATRGTFGADDGTLTPYPGMPALQSQLNLLCTAATVIDYAAANAYTDIQFEGSFAVTAEDWIAGDRDYYCFLSRASGGPITGSIAVPQVAPSETPVPTP